MNHYRSCCDQSERSGYRRTDHEDHALLGIDQWHWQACEKLRASLSNLIAKSCIIVSGRVSLVALLGSTSRSKASNFGNLAMRTLPFSSMVVDGKYKRKTIITYRII